MVSLALLQNDTDENYINGLIILGGKHIKVPINTTINLLCTLLLININSLQCVSSHSSYMLI